MEWENVDWIHLARDSSGGLLWAQKAPNFLTAWATISPGKSQLHGASYKFIYSAHVENLMEGKSYVGMFEFLTGVWYQMLKVGCIFLMMTE
jgi:hypothetical protein